LALSLLVLLAAAALSSCGGSLSFGFGTFFDDSPPSVSVAAAQASVRAGQQVRVVAAAADENGIDSVAFYRVDGNASVLLGFDTTEPYEWQVAAPVDGRSTLDVFARATDNAGNHADSAVVSIAITP
jgi:hypothetical protein